MIAVFTVILLLATAAGCFVGANFCAAGGAAQQGLIYLAGALSASVLPAVPALVQAKVSNAPARNTQAGYADTAVVFLLLCVALMAIAFAPPARAQEVRKCPQLAVCFPSYNLRVQPGVLGGWQLNLKTGDAAQGVVLTGGSVTWDNGSFPSLGVGLYGGTSISPDGARYQGSIVLDVLDWVAIGLGLQGFQDRRQVIDCDGRVGEEKHLVWQGVFSVLGKLTVGATAKGAS